MITSREAKNRYVRKIYGELRELVGRESFDDVDVPGLMFQRGRANFHKSAKGKKRNKHVQSREIPTR